MPIRAELRHHYGRHWRTVVRPRILMRAGNRCEQCRKPNGRRVQCRYLRRGPLGPRMFWQMYGRWRSQDGRFVTPPRYYSREAVIRVVLTVAHLNHVAGDDRDENLRALCQWCHLHHDAPHHKQTRSTRKDRTRPLLAALEAS